MGRGRSAALVFVLLVGLNPASFIADADGEGVTGRLDYRDTKHFSYMTDSWLCLMCVSISL